MVQTLLYSTKVKIVFHIENKDCARSLMEEKDEDSDVVYRTYRENHSVHVYVHCLAKKKKRNFGQWKPFKDVLHVIYNYIIRFVSETKITCSLFIKDVIILCLDGIQLTI